MELSTSTKLPCPRYAILHFKGRIPKLILRGVYELLHLFRRDCRSPQLLSSFERLAQSSLSHLPTILSVASAHGLTQRFAGLSGRSSRKFQNRRRGLASGYAWHQTVFSNPTRFDTSAMLIFSLIPIRQYENDVACKVHCSLQSYALVQDRVLKWHIC